RVPSLKVQKHLDLVGLGTVSDIVPLVNENRILVKHGIEALNPSEKRGIEALKEVSGIKNRRIDTRDIAFILAPRLNAGGRMDTAYDGVKMLLSHDPKEAKRIASKLEKDNRERQRVEQEIFKDAVKIIEENSDLKKERVLVIAEKGWHPGVIGIVASRLAERFSRPSILISLEKDRGRGSGRSIGGFNLFESINSLKGYLQKFGGHKYACGLEISENNIHPFRIEINRLAEEIPVEEFKPTLYVDALLSFDTLTFSMVKEFSLLSPFGLGNEEPLFITKNVEIMANPKIVSSNHIKFWVRHNNFHREVIGFGKGEYAPLLTKKQTVDLLYTPELDLWNGRNSVILKMKDIRIKNEKS
ncbi:MAG TPA: single-stranded-DNA-specific exonuclease RecJ, partial [Candidatus Omnitrophica bacterium]|nr:single-stranded-DNA-specific exonuclease RecJ [Candidatus Omnitrophota bacterium]